VGRADAAAGTELEARLLLRQRRQFGKRADAERRMRREHNRLARNLHHWHQRLERIDGHLVDVRIAANVLDHDEHRVAVRRAFSHVLDGDVAVGA